MTIGNGWGLPAGVGLMAIVAACGGAPSGDDGVGVGESSLSGSGSTSTSSSGIPITGTNASGAYKLFGNLTDCQNDIRNYDIPEWKTGACGATDYMASHQTDELECIAVGQWGYAQVFSWKRMQRASDAFTNQGTPGCNDASNCPFFCLETAFVSSDDRTHYCNTWDGTTLHMDVSYRASFTSAPSVTYQNVHWGSGNGIYTQVTDTPATDVRNEYATPCDPYPGTWTAPVFELADTRPHSP